MQNTMVYDAFLLFKSLNLELCKIMYDVFQVLINLRWIFFLVSYETFMIYHRARAFLENINCFTWNIVLNGQVSYETFYKAKMA